MKRREFLKTAVGATVGLLVAKPTQSEPLIAPIESLSVRFCEPTIPRAYIGDIRFDTKTGETLVFDGADWYKANFTESGEFLNLQVAR